MFVFLGKQQPNGRRCGQLLGKKGRGFFAPQCFTVAGPVWDCP